METHCRGTFCPALEEVSELPEEVGQVRVVAELGLRKIMSLMAAKDLYEKVPDGESTQGGRDLQRQGIVGRETVEPDLKLDGIVPTHRPERTGPMTV
jgi:hypothetical protein